MKKIVREAITNRSEEPELNVQPELNIQPELNQYQPITTNHIENAHEIKDKEGNIARILNYQQSDIFGSLLTGKIYSENELNEMKDIKVHDILTKIRNKIKKDNNINTKIYKNIVKNGTNMLEMFVNPFYDVKGLSQRSY